MTDGDDPDTELDLKLPDMTVMPSAPRHTPLELADEEPALELARPVGRARIDGGTREIVPDAPDGPDPELGRDITRKRQSQPFHIPRSLVKLLLLSLLVAAGFAIAFLRPEWLDEAKTRLSEGVEAVRPLMPEALKLPQPDDMVTIAAADFARGCLGDDTACGEDERPPELRLVMRDELVGMHVMLERLFGRKRNLHSVPRAVSLACAPFGIERHLRREVFKEVHIGPRLRHPGHVRVDCVFQVGPRLAGIVPHGPADAALH